MKRIVLISVVMMMLMVSSVCAQESMTRTLFANKEVKGGRPLIEQYDGSLYYFIRLELPVIERVPEPYKQALTAVRDTVLSKALGVKYIKGDDDYKTLTAQFEKKTLDELSGLIESMDEPERASHKVLFKWLVEYSGQMDEDSLYNPMLSHIPFFQFFLQQVEYIGNSLYTAENLVFDSHTGQLLTLDDLLDLTGTNRKAVTDLMMQEFRKNHPEETDYDYNVDTTASFEISERGLNFYIPTDNIDEDRLDYIFLDKSTLLPYLKSDGPLAKYWKE